MIKSVHNLFESDRRFTIATDCETGARIEATEMPHWYARHSVEQIMNSFSPKRLLDVEFDFCESEYKLFMEYRSRFVQCVTNDTNRCIFFNDFHNWVLKEVPKRMFPNRKMFEATWKPFGYEYTKYAQNAQHYIDEMQDQMVKSINEQIINKITYKYR